MKKWFIGIFVFSFIFSLTAFVMADSIGNGGICADSTSDGYEWCNATLKVGDGLPGGQDDYDLHWNIDWKASSSSKAYLDYAEYYTSGVASGNKDYLDYQYFYWPYTEDGSCVGWKMTELAGGCGAVYEKTMEEISSNSPYAQGNIGVWDPENGVTHQFWVNLKPTS